MLFARTKPKYQVTVRQQYCKGCDICVRLCPVSALRLYGDFNDAGYHYPVLVADCTGCRVCETICPDFAIFVEEL